MTECTREIEIVEAIAAGRTPSVELEAHAASCSNCNELITVATAMRNDMNALTQTAEPPPSGVVWWRIQRRERKEAMREAARAITLVQTATVAGAIAIALTILGGLSALTGTRQWLAGFFKSFAGAVSWSSVLPSELQPWMMVLALALFGSLALGSLAVWWAVREE